MESRTDTDRHRLSSAQLPAPGAGGAARRSDTRHDKVAAAKNALEAGTLASDNLHLADTIIDRLLGR